MLNYVKSEFYRFSRSRTVYGIIASLAGLSILFNIVLWLFNISTDKFRYATVSFSFSWIVSNPMLFCYMAMGIAAVLYESDKRSGALKNTIAYGISRIEIFVGKCIVSLVIATIMMVIILAVFTGSAMLLLEHTGPVVLADVWMESLVVFPIAAAALILAVIVVEFFEKTVISLLVWLLIMCEIPVIIFYLGLKIEFIQKLALWLPENFLRMGMVVNMSKCITIWDTTEGMIRCLAAGVAGIVIFSAAGIWLLRKKEI